MIFQKVDCLDIETGQPVKTSAAWEWFRFWTLPWVVWIEFLMGKEDLKQ